MTGKTALVAYAQRSIAKGSLSFALASRLFDRETRERAWLLYAWCRACDDITDAQQAGHGMRAVDDARERLATVRRLTDAALSGEKTGQSAFDALSMVVRETAMPDRYPRELVAGMALDSTGFRPQTEGDLMLYCWHVAGVVGVMMALIMGVSPDDRATLLRACDLGISFQLNNIARDVVEDSQNGRCYLPATWLADCGLDVVTFSDTLHRDRLASLAARLVDLAETYEDSALYGTPALPHRSAAAVIAAAGIYGAIGRKVRRLGPHAWDARVRTSTFEKLWWAVKAQAISFARFRRWRNPPPRTHLWTPPAL